MTGSGIELQKPYVFLFWEFPHVAGHVASQGSFLRHFRRAVIKVCCVKFTLSWPLKDETLLRDMWVAQEQHDEIMWRPAGWRAEGSSDLLSKS